MPDDDERAPVHRDPSLSPDSDPPPLRDPADSTTSASDDTDPLRRDVRADIGKYVSLTEFPTTAETLIGAATANGAPAQVINRLRALRPGTAFENTRELWIALGLEATDRF